MPVRSRAKRQKKDGGEADTSQQVNGAGASDASDDEMIDEEEGGQRIGGVYIPPAPPAVCSSEYNGPRMVISHIINENFKSYAGRVALGPFHKNFTSIVGPNGSGKSNVIDSMLFVFGYRATKIRSKKISVLLHKSEKHQNIRSCTVAVHFVQIKDLDDTRFEIIPNTEIAIARTAFIDNSSFYTINGKRSQFKEVASVLGSHGIDLVHNRFLILQGEVEQIAMMKPKAENKHDTGMLEYLEDIIGTARYKVPIEKLGEKVNVLYEERQGKLNKVKAAEKERDVLKEPMLEAVEFLKIENKKTMVWNSCYQRQIYDLENQLKELEQEKKDHEENMVSIKKKLKEAHDNRVAKEKEMSEKHKEIELLRNEKEKLTESFRKTDKRATQLKEEISQTNKKRKKAIEAKKENEAKVIELQNLPEKNQKEIEELKVVETKLIADREREQVVLEETMASLNQETQGLQEVKDGLSETLMGLKKTRDEAKSKYDMAKFENDMYLSNAQKEMTKLDKLKETLEKTSKTLETRKIDVEELMEKIPEGKKKLKTAQEKLNIIRKEEPLAMQELHKITSVLNEKKHSMQANRSRGRVLDFIMRQKDEGHLPGVFGRLGDLGGIDAEYDVAVSTACGPLDSIVVDTIKTGKECVEALKKYNVGRANFIALEVQEKLRSAYERPINTPENVPRLFDLINVPDDRVRPAFYYALRDTLVAADMEQAIRVAYGRTRYRVVTLSGEIIELSGTMSGGGNQKLKGRMGRSSIVQTTDLNSSNISSMENQAAELTEKISQYRQEQVQLEENISSLSREIQRWEMDLKSFKFEIEGLNKQEPLLRQQVSDQEKVAQSTAPDPKTVKTMSDNVTKLKEVLDKEAEAVNKLEKEVAEITKQIEEITGGKMQAAQQKLNAVTKKLDKVRAEITKLTVAISSAGRNLKKTQEHLRSLATEITDAEEFLLRAQAENKELLRQGNEVNSRVKAICDEIEEFDEVINKLRADIGCLVKEENTINTKKLAEAQTVDATLKSIQETKQAIPQLRKKLSNLKLNEIPGEDEDQPELFQLTQDELEEVDLKAYMYKITTYDESLRGMKPNLKAIADYEEKSAFFKSCCQELDEATKRRNEVKKAHDEIRKARLNEFMAGFTVISNKLKEMYQMITLGGDAEFELYDSLDPFAEGVVFSVRPPNKSWKEISNLSGGEKTLSSLALVFALHYYRPSPLYVMDEIDAALDYKNVSIVGNYIKERTKNAQFVVISLRSNMFELADVLVGIYKTENCTHSVTITPSKYVQQKENDDEPVAKHKRIV